MKGKSKLEELADLQVEHGESPSKEAVQAPAESKGTPSNQNPKSPIQSDLVRKVVEFCLEAKGIDIVVVDVQNNFAFADYFVIVSGRSDRQVQGICSRVLQGLAKEKIRPLSVEGLDQGHWVLIDLEDLILHVFYEPLRDHYDLESLWTQTKKYSVDPESGELIQERRAA